MLTRACLIILSTALLVLQGCVAVQTFPTVARAGDTITLAVGSPDGMTKGNTTAQFVHDDPMIPPIDLEIRSIIRLRPDNTSKVALFDQNIDIITANSKHSAWLTIIVINLSPGMPTGNGVINVSTSATYFGPSVSDLPIAIEILPGTGSANPFNYDYLGNNTPGDLSALEPMRQIVVRPPSYLNLAESYGAAEFKINAPIRKNSDPSLAVNDTAIRVVMDDNTIKNVERQTHMAWSREGDEITVSFSSHFGDMTHNQTRFSIVLKRDNHLITSPPSVISAKFYDENGVIVTNSGTPTVTDYSIATEYIAIE